MVRSFRLQDQKYTTSLEFSIEERNMEGMRGQGFQRGLESLFLIARQPRIYALTFCHNFSYLSIGLDEGPPLGGVDLVATVRAQFDPGEQIK